MAPKSKVNVISRAVVRGVAGGAFLPPEFGVSEKRTEIDSLSLHISTPRFENLTTAPRVKKEN